MGVTYQKIIKRFSEGPDANPAFIEKLRKAQRAWLAFRDAHVESIFPEGENFSARPMCVLILRNELTQARSAQLSQWVVGIEEGDLPGRSSARGWP